MSETPEVGGTCSVCGGGVRYGSRHVTCGRAVVNIERELDAARAEVERLRKDAARWGWLRRKTRGERSVDGRGQFVVPKIKPVGGIMTGSIAEHFDAAIDVALAREEKS